MDAADIERLRAAGVLPPADTDPSDRDVAARLALVRFLEDHGATVDEMIAACRSGDLPALAGDLLVTPRPSRTPREAAAQLGIDLADLEHAIRAQGFPVPDPDELSLSDGDLRILELLLPAMSIFPTDVGFQLLRVMGSSMARIAEACVAAYMDTVERQVKARGATELEHARSVHDAVALVDDLTTALGPMLANHVRHATLRTRAARRDVSDFRTARMAVGFVDLVGYTPLSARLGADALADLVGRFEGIAYDAASRVGGRVVKLIGDEVMFVAVDVGDACEIALELVDGARDDDVGVAPRGGVAYGDLLMRDGDYFGPVVNLASRIADLAVPLEVLATEEVRDALAASVTAEGATMAVTPAGRRMLKGFDEPVALVSISSA